MTRIRLLAYATLGGTLPDRPCPPSLALWASIRTFAAFAALGDPASRIYYDKKIAQGKHHAQALPCLPRRRADVLFAMLRDGTFHEPQPVRSVALQT